MGGGEQARPEDPCKALSSWAGRVQVPALAMCDLGQPTELPEPRFPTQGVERVPEGRAWRTHGTWSGSPRQRRNGGPAGGAAKRARPGSRCRAGQEPAGGAWGAEARRAEARPAARAEGGLRPGRGARPRYLTWPAASLAAASCTNPWRPRPPRTAPPARPEPRAHPEPAAVVAWMELMRRRLAVSFRACSFCWSGLWYPSMARPASWRLEDGTRGCATTRANRQRPRPGAARGRVKTPGPPLEAGRRHHPRPRRARSPAPGSGPRRGPRPFIRCQ